MKYLLIIVLLVSFSSIALAEHTCEECTKDKPCSYTKPAGDGCNTCTGWTWCSNGKWYTDGMVWCTLLGCIKEYEISNPFDKNQKENAHK